MKTYSPKSTDVVRKWYVLDASQAPLGRVATLAAGLLLGKGKPMFAHHIDCGDFVVIINAAELKVTADKLSQKTYYRHSGYPSNLKSKTLEEAMKIDPTGPVIKAVRGMLPVNKLRDGRLARLKVYADGEHQHSAQKPETLTIKGSK